MLNYAKVEELGEGMSMEEKPAEEHSAATNHCRAQTKRKTQNHLTQNNFIVAVASDTKRNSTKSHLSLQDKGGTGFSFNASQKHPARNVNTKNTTPERNEGNLELFHLIVLAQNTHTNPSLLIYYY